MEFTTLDIILVVLIAAFGGWGLWRGIAGELAAAAWIAAALVCGFFAYAPILHVIGLVKSATKAGGGGSEAAALGLTVFVALVAALLARFAVRKFVSILVPQPWNAIFGFLVGVLKGAVVVAILAATGVVETGPLANGFFASRSKLVKLLAQAGDTYKSGAKQAEVSQ